MLTNTGSGDGPPHPLPQCHAVYTIAWKDATDRPLFARRCSAGPISRKETESNEITTRCPKGMVGAVPRERAFPRGGSAPAAPRRLAGLLAVLAKPPRWPRCHCFRGPRGKERESWLRVPMHFALAVIAGRKAGAAAEDSVEAMLCQVEQMTSSLQAGRLPAGGHAARLEAAGETDRPAGGHALRRRQQPR